MIPPLLALFFVIRSLSAPSTAPTSNRVSAWDCHPDPQNMFINQFTIVCPARGQK